METKPEYLSTVYRCRGCRATIGTVNGNGRLELQGLSVWRVDGQCVHCGRVFHYNRADAVLMDFMRRLRQMHELRLTNEPQ